MTTQSPMGDISKFVQWRKFGLRSIIIQDQQQKTYCLSRLGKKANFSGSHLLQDRTQYLCSSLYPESFLGEGGKRRIKK